MTVSGPRFVNSGKIYSNLELGEGNNYLDTRKGFVYGKISALGGNDKVLGGKRSETIDGGEGNDRLVGGKGHDKLIGGLGSDNLNGGTGNDRLIGGDGIDRLTGGKGKDKFVFAAAPLPENADVVRDFKSKDDVFNFSRFAFANIGSKGRLAKDAFHKGAQAADAEDRIIYHKAKGALYYDPDGTGAEAQVQIATLSNKAKLVLSDFVIV